MSSLNKAASNRVKILPISDLHFERYRDNYDACVKKPELDGLSLADVVILAGDIAHSRFIPGMIKAVKDKTDATVLFTPGNHEFWDGSRRGVNLAEQIQEMREGIDAIEGAHFLYNEGIDIPDSNVSVFMSPWFTDLAEYEEDIDYYEIQHRIGDYFYSKFKDRYLTPDDHRMLNKEAQTSLQEWLAEVVRRGRTPVVGTHFGPCMNSAHGEYPFRDLVASYFNTPYLNHNHSLFPKGSVWIHGHTHWNVDYMIGNVRVVTNQYGYNGESSCNTEFDPFKIIEVI